jgi:hypothetical protein
MANAKFVIDSSKPLQNGDYMVVMQITAKGKQVRVTTGVKVEEENWDRKEQKVIGGKKGDPLYLSKNVSLTRLKNDINLKFVNYPDKIAKMDVRKLKSFLLGEDDDPMDSDFFRYCNKRIGYFQGSGKKKTARMLVSMRNKVHDFVVIPELDMANIKVRWLEKFEAFCLESMTTNGVATHLRYLRVVINDAIDDEIITNYPFRKFKIKTISTRKRTLTMDDIRKIRDAVFTDPPPYKKPKVKPLVPVERSLSKHRLEMSRDIWMLIFYLSGISPKDLFFIRKSDVRDNRIDFNRFKTTTLYSIKIEPEAQELISRYQGEKHMLYFADYSSAERKPSKEHTRKSVSQWKDEESFGRTINKGLTQIQKDLAISTEKLSCYSARHSVASILRSLGVSKDDIALVMGHKRPDMKITDIYTAEDFRRADNSIRLMLDALKVTDAQYPI